ncbi:helix-turn-helix transcriptional regulator [Gordonia sp. MP11Mi]|uniref:XRE family transcriptional regulator n=1 Tax=Gordonia sp. MP11Mi TaxID=3022769 RepID=A0AA97CSF8_9ACTN
MTAVYLSASEVAERIGVVRSAISRYKMPPPDALIGATRGWLPETIDAWNADRPGRGARTDLTR